MFMRTSARPTNGEGDSQQFNTDKLRDDLRLLATDMERLLKATANHTGRQVAEVRARAEESLRVAKDRICDAQETALARTRAAGKAADEFVRDNPWQVLAIVATAAIVLGFLLARPGDAD